MTGEQSQDTGADESGKWVIEAPGAGEVKLALGLGEGAELDEDQRAALAALMETLHEADVTGFADMGSLNQKFGFEAFGPIRMDWACKGFVCTEHVCGSFDGCDGYEIKPAFRMSR